MADVVSHEVRSRMMSGIRSKNTKPEMLLRKGLHSSGFRFRLHARNLPGKPDLVFPKHNAVLFAHGCFWHGHDCPLFKWPSSRPQFWKEKITRNKDVDIRSNSRLLDSGWRVGTVWECALKGPARLPLEVVIAKCSRWLKGSRQHLEIKGIQ